MNIIRKIKLNNLGYYHFTEKELSDLNMIFKFVNYSKENYEQIKFIYNNLLNLKINFKNNEIIFIHNLNSNYFYVNYNLIWLIFENKFRYTDYEINNFIESILKQTY